MSPPYASLEAARVGARLSVDALWLRYFSFGGGATPDEVGDMLAGDAATERYDHNIMAAVLNEEFASLGMDSRVAYR